MNIIFNNADEIVKILCERLRKERLRLQMTQSDVAKRAGVSSNTVSNFEAGKSISFENVVRIAVVLERGAEIESLFQPKINSLEDVARYEQSAQRQRIKRKKEHAK